MLISTDTERSDELILKVLTDITLRLTTYGFETIAAKWLSETDRPKFRPLPLLGLAFGDPSDITPKRRENAWETMAEHVDWLFRETDKPNIVRQTSQTTN